MTSSIASTSSGLSIVKSFEKRTTKCLRCDHQFKMPCDLYRHLWNNKTDCKIDSTISIEEAKKHANPPDFYKCQFCKEIIIDKTKRDEHELKCDKKDIIDTFSVNNIDPLISYLFVFDDDGTVITNVDKETGYINATLMCKLSKKELKEYFKNDSTKKLIYELEKRKNKYVTCSDENPLSTNINLQQSLIFEKPSILNAKVNHTYVQETIAIDLAGWCNVKYKIIVYEHIINYKNGLIKTKDSGKAKKDIEDINNGTIKINIISSTDYTNKHSPQFYMRKLINKPSEVELVDYSGNRIIDDEYIIFKGGSQGDHTGRQGNHISQLKGSIHLDSIECFNYTKLEEYAKDIAREMNILCAIQNSGKDLNGTEYYIFKTQEEYSDFINKIYKKSKELNKNANENSDLEIENIKLKQEEQKTKQLELQIKLALINKDRIDLINNNTNNININTTNDVVSVKKKRGKNKPSDNKIGRKRTDENKILNDYIGVCKKTYNSVFCYDAKFYKDGKHYYLGTYETPQIAAYAYNCKKISLGDRTKLNNVDLSNDYNWNDNINRLIKIPMK
jgi:KilA-N domain